MSTAPDLHTLDNTRKGFQSVTNGKDVDEDEWMTTWCSTNWGVLLQPAPLSISVLGALLIVASSTDDFSLTDTASGAPKYQWKFAKDPDSFITCLQQMVGDGYNVFGTAHKQMQIISDTSGAMPGVMSTLAGLAAVASLDDIKAQFHDNLTQLQDKSKICSDAAKNIDDAFADITGLIQEMVIACTHKIGSTEQALDSNETQLAVLKVQKTSQAKAVATIKASQQEFKKSYTKAQAMFSKAIDDVPSGWDLMGMHVVDALTSFAVSAGNALVSSMTVKSQAEEAGINAFSKAADSVTDDNDPSSQPASDKNTPAELPVANTTSPNNVQSQPNATSLADPAVSIVPIVLTQLNGIKALLVGGKGGKPDWTNIRAQGSSKSGAAYIQDTLKLQTDDLNPSMPVSKSLSTDIDSALTIVAHIIKVAGNVEADDKSLADQVDPTETIITNVESLQTSVNLLLQQPGTASTGPATTQTPTAAATTDTVQLAVQNAQMKVTQTRAQLEASQKSYQDATTALVAQQSKMTETVASLTHLTLTDTTLEKMLPVLKRAVGSFTTLRAQFSKLVQFFDSIASLIEDVLRPTAETWMQTLEDADKEPQERQLAGITMSAFTRDLVYRQVVTPYKIAILTNKISATYLEVSTQFILPAQRTVGTMLKFPAADTPAAKEKLISDLQKAQTELATSTQTASAGIVALVQKDQKSFEDQMNTRVKTIQNTLKEIMPAVVAPLPDHIKGVVDAHVRDTAKTRAMQASVNPALNPSDLV
ncbi:hypothetical protein K438DRAFT_2028860 [Mycena galopus ATCC 62051]|nr:hypothetical protein K438DRAFT_2028860 [Mycena galopus ATCC 62051]